MNRNTGMTLVVAGFFVSGSTLVYAAPPVAGLDPAASPRNKRDLPVIARNSPANGLPNTDAANPCAVTDTGSIGTENQLVFTGFGVVGTKKGDVNRSRVGLVRYSWA